MPQRRAMMRAEHDNVMTMPPPNPTNTPRHLGASTLRGTTLGRRRVLGCCGAAVAGLFTSIVPRPARAALWNECKEPALPTPLRELVASALDGLDATALWDVHAHLLGNGDSGSGCMLNPSLVKGFNLLERGRHRAILNAACVPGNAASVDRAYVARLRSLAEAFPAGARWLLFAFDHTHGEDGRERPEQSTFFVPNSYAAATAQAHGERFGWVASIHPYGERALERLDAVIAQGALAIKWLPSAMNIDLRDKRVGPFYDRLATTKLPLIIHAGEEKAVPGAGRDDLGNPLLLRAPLERGVRVIAAHAASLGHALDLDQTRPRKKSCFELFTRLMEERAHADLLLADVSAVFQANRDAAVWRVLLSRRDWHARLLHGSDYPLPGLMPLHRSLKWMKAGLIDEAGARRVDELRAYNPLLADLVVKRVLRYAGAGFGPEVFDTRRHFVTNGSTS
jgi:predicted TIM-barrel fold metal-dependent hydrolase